MGSLFRYRQSTLRFMLLTGFLPLNLLAGNNAWLSGTSTDGDAGNCNINEPCFSFDYASLQVYGNSSVVGEVFVMTPGVYPSTFSPINWGKSQTWDGGDGNLASLVGTSIQLALDNPIDYPGFTSSNVFILRNLTLIGEGLAQPAIQTGTLFNGATLIIENCKIYGYAPGTGVGVINCLGGGPVIIKDTIIENNEGDAILIDSIGNVSLSRLAIKNNSGNGLNITGAVVDISDSVITQNTEDAILASGSGTIINCVNNVVTSNGTFIEVGSSGLVRISNNDIYNNTAFINYMDDTGQVETANNNRVGSNGSSPASPTGSIATQ